MKSYMAILIIGGEEMKKLLAGIFTTVLLLTAGTAGVMAADSKDKVCPSADRCSVNCNTLSAACRYTDENSAGICDNLGTTCDNDRNHVEENHHSDHNASNCRQDGHTQRHGHGGNHHN